MPEQDNDFPQVQGGGSLILAWQIRGKRVLVIGGGEVSLSCCYTVLMFLIPFTPIPDPLDPTLQS